MRLSLPGTTRVGASVTMRFDDQEIDALEGETIAAALSAAGILTFRRTLSGAPRGLHCGMGACQDCVVTVDGRIGQRACVTPVRAGMDARSGAPAAIAVTDATPESEERSVEVLVVGAGPAGLAAATAAAEAGAHVVLLDERSAPGGQYTKPLGHALFDTSPDARFRLGLLARSRAERAGVTIETDSLVWACFAPDEVAALIKGVSVTFHPRRLILAPGAHERPVPLPGWTLPGVLTTGGLQTLIRTQLVCPGDRVLLAGTGPLNLQVACEMIARGVKPVAVLDNAPTPYSASWRDAMRMLQAAPDLMAEAMGMLVTLRRAGVPVLWSTTLRAITGDGRVEAAVLPGRNIPVDIVALNAGFQPEVGLARALGLPHRFVDSGMGHLATATAEDGRSALGSVFAVGDGAALGGARVAMARGRLAGLACARDLGHAVAEDGATRDALRRAVAFQDALWRVFPLPPTNAASIADETIVCRCEEVTAGRLRAELAGGLTSLAALKKATRAGMGRCQGRFCSATVARLCPMATEPDEFAAPRAPVRPVPAAPLMREAPEFVAPLLEDLAPPSRDGAAAHARDGSGERSRDGSAGRTREEAAGRTRDGAVEFSRDGSAGYARDGGCAGEPAGRLSAQVVVIGGGIAGLCTAYYLARVGADVLIVDRDELGMAASTANAGSLHVQLLSYDFTNDTPEDGGPAAHTLPLAPRSIALWKEIGGEVGESLGIRTEGGLMLAEDETSLGWLRRKSAMERRWGIESHVLGANELRALAPSLSERMVGADFVPAEGYGDPLRGTLAVRTLALRHGARALTGAEVRSITRDGGHWEIETSRSRIEAGTVVNATGPWAARTGRMVGLNLPVTGTVQQVMVTEPAPAATTHLIALANRHLSLKQQASGGYLVGGGWFGGFDPATGWTRNLRRSIEGNLFVCGRVLPALRGLSIVRGWTGINPAIDRAPLLGEAPGLPGFWNTVTANGYTLGPIAGMLTAQAILHGEAIDPWYTVERFG
jgi:glycine/D-amino acid oxidase-like deaminating enzyme